MPSIFDFDQTISIEHTFLKFKIESLVPVTEDYHYELGKSEAATNTKKEINDYFKHDNNNLSAIATWHNNPDFIAGYIAELLGKQLVFEKTTTSEELPIAINHYKVEDINTPFLISYVPCEKDNFQKAISLLANKNPQLELLRETMLKQQLIEDDSIIDFYEDTEKNYTDAKSLPYIRGHYVDRDINSFHIIESQRISPRRTKSPKLENNDTKPQSELQKDQAETNNKYATSQNNDTDTPYASAGRFSFFHDENNGHSGNNPGSSQDKKFDI